MAAPPAPVGDARRAGLERALSAGILLAGIAVWTGFRAYTRITLEDALITFRYAANLAEGLGFVYNAGERVLGTTTPLFTLLLGGIGALAGPDRVPEIALVTMMAASAGAAWLTGAAVRALGFGGWTPHVVMAAFVLHPEIAWTTTGGMETPLVLLFMAAGLHAVARRRWCAAAAFSALLVLTRIDGALWAAGIGLIILIEDRRALPRCAAVAAAILIPWVVFSFIYFGSPVPHSLVAKRSVGAQPGIADWSYLVGLLRWTGPFLGASFPLWHPAGSALFGLGAWGHARRGARPALCLLAVFPIGLVAALGLGRSPFYFDWYLTPMVWASLLVGLLGLAGLRRALRLPAAAAAALCALYLSAVALATARDARFHRNWQLNEDGMRRQAGEWLARETPQSASVAMEAIGYQGYYSNRRVIDLAGLVSPRVVALSRESWSHGEAFYRILREVEPDYLVLRSYEVDRNLHYHGGRLFDTAEHRSFFAGHYEEVRRFEAPLPGIWGPTSHLTVYRRTR